MKTLIESAQAAKAASVLAALLDTDTKNRALDAMADALMASEADILEANAADVAHGREKGTPEPMLDRLALTAGRIDGIAEGVRQVAALPDPVGEVLDEWTTAVGLRIQKVRVPMPRDKRVVRALLRLGKAGHAARGTQLRKAGRPAREQFMRIALVAHVEHQPVFFGIIYAVDGNGQLHRAEIRRQMPAGAGQRLYEQSADFRAQLPQLLRFQRLDVRGALYAV